MERLEAGEITGGIFVILGMVFLAAFLFSVGQKEGFFKKGYTLPMQGQNLAGLKTGDPVVLKGLEIGYVKAARFVESGQEILAEAELFIFENYRDQIPASAAFRIEDKDFIGKHEVVISFEKKEGPFLKEGDVVKGTVPLPWADLKLGMKESMESVRKTSDEARRLVKQLEKKTLDGDLFKVF